MSSSDQFIHHLPKIELHAHLSGSLSDETVTKLLDHKQDEGTVLLHLTPSLSLGNRRSLKECFDIFKIIHSLTNNIGAVKMLTSDVIREFYEDNVCYLELRTTPKSVDGSYNKHQYLEAVLESVVEAEQSKNIMIRLLVSIDRARGVDDGWDTMNLTVEFLKHEIYGKYICGVDVSGNPNVGSLKNFIPILQEARNCGLKISSHLLEVNTETAFVEAEEILSRGLTDRIGHATFLHPLCGGSSKLTNIVKEKKIPIELCISSNLKCNSVQSLEKHHAKLWKDENHPIAVCTDDKGVFSTTLSQEIELFRQVTGANTKDLCDVMRNTVQSSFLENGEKTVLLDKIDSYMAKLDN